MSGFQPPSTHPTSPFVSDPSMDYLFNSASQSYPFGVAQPSGVGQPMDMDAYAHPQPQNYQFNSSFAFHNSFQYDPSQIMHQAPTHSHLSSGVPSRPVTVRPSRSPVGPTFDSLPIIPTEMTGFDESQLQRSSSEEKENMTPQQNKRKAQNRAAQRAFRERKEQHLKSLETRLNALQQQSISKDTEIERLRNEKTQMATELEILRATSHAQPSLGEDEDEFPPLGYTAADYAIDREARARRAQMLGTIHTIVIDENSGDRLLNSGKTWDYILDHALSRDGHIDVGDVIERLKKQARCDGQGPVFRENDIRKAIVESAVAGGRDELI